MEGAAKETGEKTVEHIADSEQGQQQLDNAKAHAQVSRCP